MERLFENLSRSALQAEEIQAFDSVLSTGRQRAWLSEASGSPEDGRACIASNFITQPAHSGQENEQACSQRYSVVQQL